MFAQFLENELHVLRAICGMCTHIVRCGGTSVDSTPFVRRVANSNPALTAT